MSRFDDRFIDEVKSRLRLSDVVGRTVTLKRQGGEYAGLSPFSKEKTPSFYVNDDKGFYHCFSSGKHGDVIDWFVETEQMGWVEAIEHCAALAGVTIPARDAETQAREKQRRTLQDWLAVAQKWFEAELRRPGGRAAAEYLRKRGLPESEWVRFGCGFAPAARTGLKDYLLTKGCGPQAMAAAGLIIEPSEGGASYDRFRDRIMFPITDHRGAIISFAGRALNTEAKAKYLNGPDTDLFDKGRVLYGLAEARKMGPLVLVEGYMDVIACHRGGIAAVSPMGTALTEDQMHLAWRHDPEPTICLDGDDAGQRAAGRAIDRALPLLAPGRSFKFAAIDGGKDPDEVLREHGPEALKLQLARTVPFVEALFARERGAEPLDTPEQQIAFRRRLRACAGAIADRDLANAYNRQLQARADAILGDSQPRQGPGTGRGPGRYQPPPPPVTPGLRAAAQALRSREAMPSSSMLMTRAEAGDQVAEAGFDLVARYEEVQGAIAEIGARTLTTDDFQALLALRRERTELRAAIREGTR